MIARRSRMLALLRRTVADFYADSGFDLAAAHVPDLTDWEAARLLFSRSLATIVGLLLWTYTGMAILLIGAELASILNGRSEPSTDPDVAFAPSGVS